MNAEELIKNNSLSDIEVSGKQKVVFVEIANTAVNMARLEMKQRAIEAFRYFMEYCHESGIMSISNDSEHYLDVFKKELQK